MSDTLRTFIAIELPRAIVASIRTVQEGMRSCGLGVSWVRPENIHLTLKFLGNIPHAQAEKVGVTMSETVRGVGPLSLSTKGIGAFPGIARPRVIWVGVSGQTDALKELQKGLEERLAAMGFPRENRPFRGHLTLARVKGKIDPRRLGEAMKEFAGFESETFIADQIHLFKSELKPTGAIYTKIVSGML